MVLTERRGGEGRGGGGGKGGGCACFDANRLQKKKFGPFLQIPSHNKVSTKGEKVALEVSVCW